MNNIKNVDAAQPIALVLSADVMRQVTVIAAMFSDGEPGTIQQSFQNHIHHNPEWSSQASFRRACFHVCIDILYPLLHTPDGGYLKLIGPGNWLHALDRSAKSE